MKVKDMLLKLNLDLNKLYELEVSDTYITGTTVLPIIPITEQIKTDLERTVIDKGYWVYFIVGHTMSFIICNFNTLEEAEVYEKECKEDSFLYDVHIMNI